MDRKPAVAPSIALEHNKVPDPVAQELEMIEKELEKLRENNDTIQEEDS